MKPGPAQIQRVPVPGVFRVSGAGVSVIVSVVVGVVVGARVVVRGAVVPHVRSSVGVGLSGLVRRCGSVFRVVRIVGVSVRVADDVVQEPGAQAVRSRRAPWWRRRA